MSPKIILPTAAALTGLLFVSCAENPADQVEAAEVSAPTNESAKAAVSEAEGSPDAKAAAEKTTYVFTPDSSIHFIGSKVTGQHGGDFTNFTGHFTVTGESLASDGSHEVVIDMNSTTTDNEKLTAHLKNEDFFDVPQFPTAKFALNSAEKIEGDQYKLSGELTLHGITKAISLPATVTGDSAQVQVQSEFSINRMDFGIRFPGKPDDLIREEVVIQLNLKAVPGTPNTTPSHTAPLSDGAQPAITPPAATSPRPMGRPSAAPPSAPPVGAPPSRPDASAIITHLDKNGDGKLTAEEAPPQLWENLVKSDTDGDGAISPDELKAMHAVRQIENGR